MSAKKQNLPQGMRLRRVIEYDTMRPEDTIRDFLRFLREAKARYTENLRLIAEYQLQMQDIEHYAEMADNLDRTAGHALYRKLRDIRRERRLVKNETELLELLVTFIDDNGTFIKRLEHTQGMLGVKKAHIDQLGYTMKTKVFDQRQEVNEDDI